MDGAENLEKKSVPTLENEGTSMPFYVCMKIKTKNPESYLYLEKGKAIIHLPKKIVVVVTIRMF